MNNPGTMLASQVAIQASAHASKGDSNILEAFAEVLDVIFKILIHNERNIWLGNILVLPLFYFGIISYSFMSIYLLISMVLFIRRGREDEEWCKCKSPEDFERESSQSVPTNEEHKEFIYKVTKKP